MKSFTVKSYWKSYKELSRNIQKQADIKFELWIENPFHPSLRFKCVNSEDNIWSVRVNMDYRALAVRKKDNQCPSIFSGKKRAKSTPGKRKTALTQVNSVSPITFL